MTNVSNDRLFARFKANPPASLNSVARCQADLGFPLPDDCVQFLQQMNGGEGFVGKHYLMAWPIEELIPGNKQCVVDHAVGVLLLFGSDGGGGGGIRVRYPLRSAADRCRAFRRNGTVRGEEIGAGFQFILAILVSLG
jgi:SMI1/KNR4 family protein SUKH-1